MSRRRVGWCSILLAGLYSLAGAQQSWWYFTSGDGLFRVEADGSAAHWLTPDDPQELRFASIAADPTSSRVYANASGRPFVYTDLAGQDLTVFAQTVFPEDLAVDRWGQLFVTQSRRIMRVEPSGAIELTFQGPGVNRGLAIDDENGYLYWTREITGGDGIFRARKDGSGLEQILGSFSTISIGAIALTDDGSRMFWTVSDGFGTGQVWTALADGTGATQLRSGLSTLAIGLTVNPLDNRLYWSDEASEQIFRMDLDGSGFELFFDGATVGEEIQDIALYIAPAPAGVGLAGFAAFGLALRRRRAEPLG